MAPPQRLPGPDLSPETIRRLDVLFAPDDRQRAEALLYEQCGQPLREVERCRIAALKFSDGDLTQLESAVKLAQIDFRDLLVAVGFANDTGAHLKWHPKPAGEPSQINTQRLAEAIHERLAAILTPLGFVRRGEAWRREGEVPQILVLQNGVPNRIEAKFFLRVTLDSKPMGLLMPLPKMPMNLAALREQGYIFRVGGSEEELCQEIVDDLVRYAQPLFERFTSNAEVQRGFADGTFQRSLPLKDQALLF